MPDYVWRIINDVEYRVLPVLADGRYEVEYILAAGGQGFTCVARDTKLSSNRVLIKVPLYGSEKLGLGPFGFKEAKEEQDYDLLDHEVPIVLELNRRVQNVPRILGYFQEENVQLYGTHRLLGEGGETWEIHPRDDLARDFFLVYEFLSAGAKTRAVTLEDVIEERGALAERFVLRMALQIADVLAELHAWQDVSPTEEGEEDELWVVEEKEDFEDDYQDVPQPEKYFYIYQDLKPANILVTGERHFFLIDFGGVVRCNLSFDNRRPVFRIEDQTGAFTAGYAPPEFAENPHSLDWRFDIFGLGATMFHALSGVSPVHLLTDPMNPRSAPDFSWPNIRDKAPDYGPQSLVQAIVFNATREHKLDRYRSIQRMRMDIVRALEGG